MTTDAVPASGSYLRVDELLAPQRERSDPPHHDALLLVAIHHVYELWFKQVLTCATRTPAFRTQRLCRCNTGASHRRVPRNLPTRDALLLLWRGQHVRMIGMKAGTGAFFPELWAVRTELGS